MVLGSICGVAHGLTIVYLGQAFDPLAALDAIQAEGCQAFGGVPTMFVSILNPEAAVPTRSNIVPGTYKTLVRSSHVL
jgi:fatty-acyl-CoA synthase